MILCWLERRRREKEKREDERAERFLRHEKSMLQMALAAKRRLDVESSARRLSEMLYAAQWTTRTIVNAPDTADKLDVLDHIFDEAFQVAEAIQKEIESRR